MLYSTWFTVKEWQAQFKTEIPLSHRVEIFTETFKLRQSSIPTQFDWKEMKSEMNIKHERVMRLITHSALAC